MHIDLSGKWAPLGSNDGSSTLTNSVSILCYLILRMQKNFLHVWDVFSTFILISFIAQRICVDPSGFFFSLPFFVFSFVQILLKVGRFQWFALLVSQLYKRVSTWIQLKS